jgi:hypothetical protein
MRTLRLLVASALVAFAVVAPSIARADQAEAEARVVARRLGQEAMKLYDAGKYAEALEKLDTADHLVPTPTLGLFAARCLARLGRLVEASERYLEVSRMKLDRFAPAVMRKALVDAVDEREKLLPRIPVLVVRVTGPRGEGVAVLVDDKPLLPALIGEKRPIDPGPHVIVSKRADTSVRREATLREGETTEQILEMPALPLPPLPPLARTPTLRWIGWGAIGVGAAGVSIGLVSGIIAASKAGSLLDACPSHVCPNAQALAQTSGYDTARAVSTAGFVVGAVGLAAGVPILLFTPKTELVPQERPAPVVVSVGPARASASFAF